MRIKRWQRPSLSGMSEQIIPPQAKIASMPSHMVPSTVLTLPQHLLLPKSWKGICSRRSNYSHLSLLAVSCSSTTCLSDLRLLPPAPGLGVPPTHGPSTSSSTELKLLETSSGLVVLNLKRASESPGGLIRTDSWTPSPLFLIQHRDGE